MISVLLRLEGPLQSWGTRSRFGQRDTEREPSKSGVLGIMAAALGMPRDDDEMLARLASARVAIRVDREGTVLSDYHSVGGGTFHGEPHFAFEANAPILTHRDDLMGASFLCALTFDDASLASQVHQALAAPHWPLYLGRKACPPSLPVYVPDGLVEADCERALRDAPFPRAASNQDRDDEDDADERTRLLVECSASDDGAQARQDQPLSFRLSRRRFAQRYQRTLWIAAADRNLQDQESPCISLAAY